MNRVALVSSEPLRERMAGIGIRYLEFARRLPRAGVKVRLIHPGEPADTPAVGPDCEVRRFERAALTALLSGCDVIVAQGQLANDVLLAAPGLPAAIDLYDPFLVENLHYADTLGLEPYRRDHATWVLQLGRGDFFLCSSEEQRGFYLGFLTALGRVNPEVMAGDPDLERLVAVVPFGVPEELPSYRPYLPPRAPGERRILFGGLYDWYDPWTLVEAIVRAGRPGWKALFMRNPNPGSTPQRLLGELDARLRRAPNLRAQIEILDWVEAERRYDLLRDVDVLAAPHRATLETRLSLRTRFLDALAVGCPVVVSAGGAMERLLSRYGAGWIVPPGDPDALGAALLEILDGDARARTAGAERLVVEYAWERVLGPLVRFCRAPWRHGTGERLALGLAPLALPEALRARANRWLRRVAGRR